jgi:hypothetical protein
VNSKSLMGGFKLSNRRWYPWLFLLLCILFLVFAYEFVELPLSNRTRRGLKTADELTG